MWFSKFPKLSKKQYEKAREVDEFKIHTKEEWKELLNSLINIKSKYNVRDAIEKNFYYIPFPDWYPKDEQPTESWMYYRISGIVAYIGDGWGSGYIRSETVYITDDFVISDASGHHTFTELENGDLLVQDKIVTKKTDYKTITEIDSQRYDCGKWRKKIIDTEYKKQLIDDEDYITLKVAVKYCEDFEKIYNINEGIKNGIDSCEK